MLFHTWHGYVYTRTRYILLIRSCFSAQHVSPSSDCFVDTGKVYISHHTSSHLPPNNVLGKQRLYAFLVKISCLFLFMHATDGKALSHRRQLCGKTNDKRKVSAYSTGVCMLLLHYYYINVNFNIYSSGSARWTSGSLRTLLVLFREFESRRGRIPPWRDFEFIIKNKKGSTAESA